MPLPPNGIVRAALRWATLLQRSQITQAWALIRADPQYSDLSPTQYRRALEWLTVIGAVEDGPNGPRLAQVLQRLPLHERDGYLFARGIEYADPIWLKDADVLIRRKDELPADATAFADTLGVSDQAALGAVRQVHGHIDLARRAEVGALGERKLVALIEEQWPGAATHVALDHDGFGYDISVTTGGNTWHLEVKTTTRRGRLIVYLSRHEYEISLLDEEWHLVVLGLLGDDIACMATVTRTALVASAPSDHLGARWESARFDLSPAHLRPGIPVTGFEQCAAPLAHVGVLSGFSWMPAPTGTP